MDLAGDPAARRARGALETRASSLDVCHVCGEGARGSLARGRRDYFLRRVRVQVHLSCYGLTKVPEGEWRCVGCEDGVDAGEADEGEFGVCALCPQPGGALARLDPPSAWDVAWESPGTHAHLACADCLPEVFVIKDAPGREGKPPLIDMSFVKAARINLRCSLCGQEGACTQCAMRKCFASFHPLCARAAGFAWERHAQDGRPVMFCKTHSGDRARRGTTRRRGETGETARRRRRARGFEPRRRRQGEKQRRGRARSVDAPRGRTRRRQREGQRWRLRPPTPRRRSRRRRRAPVGRLAPFLRSTRDRTRLGKASRKMLASSSLDENERARLASLDDEAGAAEFARIVASRDAEVDNALARVATAAAGAPVAALELGPRFAADRERRSVGSRRGISRGSAVWWRTAWAPENVSRRSRIFCIFATGWDSEGRTSSRVRGKTPRRGSPISTGGVRNCERCRSRVPRTSGRPPRRRRCARGIDVVIVPTDALIESSAALVAKEKAEKEMKAEKEAKEVKAEEEEKDAAAVNTRTDPDAGASDPTAVPSSVARNRARRANPPPIVARGSRRTRATAFSPPPRFACPSVVSSWTRTATRRRRSPRARRGVADRRVVYSRVIVVGGALRPRATVDADAARNLRAALALVLPEPFAAADAVDGIDASARAPRGAPRRRRVARRAGDDDQRASPFFSTRRRRRRERRWARPDARDDRSRSRRRASVAGE